MEKYILPAVVLGAGAYLLFVGNPFEQEKELTINYKGQTITGTEKELKAMGFIKIIVGGQEQWTTQQDLQQAQQEANQRGGNIWQNVSNILAGAGSIANILSSTINQINR